MQYYENIDNNLLTISHRGGNVCIDSRSKQNKLQNYVLSCEIYLFLFVFRVSMDEKRYIKRKEKARTDGNREQVAISCKQLGDYYNECGKYNEAANEYKEEATIYASMGKELETAKAKRMLGEMFMLLLDYDAAKDHINDYLSK